MDVARYQRAQSIFDKVVELPAAERQAALETLCGGDRELLGLVTELVEIDSHASLVEQLDERIENAPAHAAAAPPERLQPGSVVERYVVERLLGVGGTAQVWAVRHSVLGTRHALKVLIWADPDLQRRLLREARAQATLRHPNIVPVSDVLEVGGSPGLLMPLIEGPALDELLREYRPTTEEAVALIRAVATGVGHAHASGFAHRDLKPGNVMMEINEAGGLTPRVADFGLVKGESDRDRTRTGVVMGTITYAAPEQLLDSSAADDRADLWSIGVMLFELLKGQRPFQGRTLTAVQQAHEQGPDLSGIEEPLASVLHELLQPDPELRRLSCADLLARLPEGEALGPESGLAAMALHYRDTHLQPLEPPPARQSTLKPSETATWSEALPAEDTEQLAALREERAAPPRRRALPLAVLGGALALGLGGLVVKGLSGDAGTAAVEAPRAATERDPDATPSAPDEASAAQEEAPDAGEEPGALAEVPDAAEATAAEATAQEAPPEPAAIPAQLAPDEPAVTDAAPEPAPEEARPEEPAEEASTTPAQVVITGDATDVRLVGADGRIYAPGPVPPGRYTLEATLPHPTLSDSTNLVTRDLGELASGQVVRVRCDGLFSMCSLAGGP